MSCVSLQTACVAIAALLQYFLMAAFFWMLVEGIYLYLLVVKVYNIENKMHMYHMISWGTFLNTFLLQCLFCCTLAIIFCLYASTAGFPAAIVAMSLSIAAGKDGIHSFVDNE